LIWATENPLKIRPLSAVLFWQISANICVCRFITFFFSSFDHGIFGDVATIVYALYVVVWVETWSKKGWFNVMLTLMLLIDCPRTPRNIQEVQASKLGDAPEAPLLHRQKSGHLSTHYIFIASRIMRFSWSISCFSF
jgi:hypothetical protein